VKGTWILLAAAVAFGQSRPEFEVASIRPSGPPILGKVNIGVHIDGAQVNCNYLSLKDYIGMAYKVKYYQIQGPDWIASERFNIAAKLPAGAGRPQVGDMVQALLEDRFKLKLHRDTKEFPVYGLVVAKGGLKMKESPPDETGDGGGAINVTASGSREGTTVDMGKGSYFHFGNNRLEGKKLTMAGLAETLGRFADRPVVDMTGVGGMYDLTLEVTPEDFRAMQVRAAMAAGVTLPPEAMRALEGGSGSLFTAVQSLGLKLEPRKAPLEVLVIDHAEKTPTEN